MAALYNWSVITVKVVPNGDKKLHLHVTSINNDTNVHYLRFWMQWGLGHQTIYKKTVKSVCSPSWRNRYCNTYIYVLLVIMFADIIGMGKLHLNDQRSSFYFRPIPLLSLRKYYFTDLSCEHCLLFSSNTKLPSGSWDEKVTPSHSKVFTWIKIEASTILSWFDWEWERERGK